MATNKLEIEIGKRTIWRIVIFSLAFFLVLRLRSLIFYLLFALLFAIAIYPLVRWFQAKGLKHHSALALALIILVGGIFILSGVVLVSLVETVSNFVSDLPRYIESLRQYSITADYVDPALEAYESIDSQELIQSGLISSGGLIAGLSKAFEAVLFTFFFTVYMLLERDYLRRIVHSLIPTGWKRRARDMEKELVEVVGKYIRGQLLTSFLMGLASYAIFRALNIPNAFALGIIAGITDVIPVIGGLIGLIPAVLVAITISPTVAILAIILVQTYSTISNYFIRPVIFGSALDMSPFIVTVATMTGLLLFGIPGIILALPSAAMIGYVLTKYYNVPILEEDYNVGDT